MTKVVQQKLFERNTYTHTDASQVRSFPVAMSLNREETLSEHSLKTSDNNPDENLLSGKRGQNLRVSVLNMQNQPLMPTTPGKARRLIKEGKAKVIRRTPFTIRLTKATGETKQSITLGIDSGYKTIGFSAVTEKEELISGELNLRTNVSKKLTNRAMYRRLKRSRLWHRQPRFSNRAKKKGWLAPSVQHKVDTHIRLIDKLKALLPITKVIVEAAKFDAQKLQNPDIQGTQYQEGQMQGYDNLRAFILQRDNYTCQICKKKKGIMNIHHIIQRKDGGSDRPDNLVTVHKSCHEGFHAGKTKHKFTKPKSFKQTPTMNSIRKYVVDLLGCDCTYGYITKRGRLDLGLEKSHINDAFVIAQGTTQTRQSPYTVKQARRNNRCLQVNRQGYRPSIRRQRHKFQPGDIVRYKNTTQEVKSSFKYGKYVKLIDKNQNLINANTKKVKLLKHGKGLQFKTLDKPN